jgi:hypothetical protein
LTDSKRSDKNDLAAQMRKPYRVVEEPEIGDSGHCITPQTGMTALVEVAEIVSAMY